jgi:hypothetical protein
MHTSALKDRPTFLTNDGIVKVEQACYTGLNWSAEQDIIMNTNNLPLFSNLKGIAQNHSEKERIL